MIKTKDVEKIYEILRLRYIEKLKYDEIINCMECSKPTIMGYCKKISKEDFISHFESGEKPSDFIKKHSEVFCQQRVKHKLTNEHCELIRELCIKHLNCYISKEDAQIIFQQYRFEKFYIKHQSEWMNEDRNEYNLEHEKFIKKLNKETEKIQSGSDLGKNFKEVYELYYEDAKDKDLKPVSYGSFYLEAQKYWIEEE